MHRNQSDSSAKLNDNFKVNTHSKITRNYFGWRYLTILLCHRRLTVATCSNNKGMSYDPAMKSKQIKLDEDE